LLQQQPSKEFWVFVSSLLSCLNHKLFYEFTSESEFVNPKTRWINARVLSRLSLAAARSRFLPAGAFTQNARVEKNNEKQKNLLSYVRDNLCSRSSARSVFRARDPTPPPNRCAKTGCADRSAQADGGTQAN
jgi:hypothetical protein